MCQVSHGIQTQDRPLTSISQRLSFSMNFLLAAKMSPISKHISLQSIRKDKAGVSQLERTLGLLLQHPGTGVTSQLGSLLQTRPSSQCGKETAKHHERALGILS